LYHQNLVNFESARYWFDYLSKEEFRKQFFGSVPHKKEAKTILPLQFANGTIAPTPVVRAKRQAVSLLPPECVNLPAYKNWVEEGKLGPVQNQGRCGEIEKLFLNFLYSINLFQDAAMSSARLWFWNLVWQLNTRSHL
jgi:hypothetical protein